MNKKELVACVAKKTGKSLKESEVVLDGVLDSIVDTILKGEAINLLGFGSFVIKEFAPRVGYNPSTKTSMQIPAKRVVKFKAGAKLVLRDK